MQPHTTRPGRAAEKLLTTPGMRQIQVGYRPDPEPEARATARPRVADARAHHGPAKGTAADTLRGFLIGAGGVVIIAAGVAVGVYLMA